MASAAQQQSVSVLERAGWNLLFVRRPLFQDVTAVLESRDGDHYAGVDEHGHVLEGGALPIRERDMGHAERSATWYAGPASGSSILL